MWFKRSIFLPVLMALGLPGVGPAHVRVARASGGVLQVEVVDKDSGKPIACRMHLKNSRGRPRKVPGLPFWKDHFVFPGQVRLKLPHGAYTFEIERGPEYVNVSGHFTIEDHADDTKVIELKRAVNMAAEGWYSGDLHVHRPIKDIELLMRAEDLHVAPVITWWNNKNAWASGRLPKQPVVRFDGDRIYDTLAGEDERGGGALLFFRLPKPLPLAGAAREYPSSVKFLLEAKQYEGAWVDAEKPFWWDFPLWLATGQIDSIELANNHMCRGQMIDNEAWGRPRDRRRLRGALGNGLWSQEIYYHVLEAGLRIPPSAGSASGVLPNPLGYDRVYVHVGEAFSYDNWWKAFRQGRVVVTNGPLLRPLVGGKNPGHVFRAESGKQVTLDVVLSLSTRDPISYLEIVKNGQVEHTVRLDEWAKNGTLPAVTFRESGWMLVRAVTDVERTYRFASTGPYYVEIGNQPRISRRSVQFFLDWLDQRRDRLKLDDAAQRDEVLKYYDQARGFWNDRLSQANAD